MKKHKISFTEHTVASLDAVVKSLQHSCIVNTDASFVVAGSVYLVSEYCEVLCFSCHVPFALSLLYLFYHAMHYVRSARGRSRIFKRGVQIRREMRCYRRHGRGYGKGIGYPFPRQLEGLGEHRKLPQWGVGRSTSCERFSGISSAISCIF